VILGQAAAFRPTLGVAYRAAELGTSHGVKRRGGDLMVSDGGERDRQPDDQPVEEIDEEIAEKNPDPITRREALQQELAQRGRSDEGKQLGDHIE